MIIELFGPPGAGKTTLSRALIARLRERGHSAALRLSYRPSERLQTIDTCRPIARRYRNAVVDRLRRPFVETLSIARHPLANSRDVMTALQLVRLLPPANILASIKEGQYLLRLSHSWYDESRLARVALFDQGFVQAVCSLALLASGADDALIASALECAPKSDLLIRLNAPEDVLMARLCERHRSQSAIERFLELDLNRNLEAIRITERLYDLLRERGQPVTCASSLDQRSLRESVEQIEQQLVSKLATERAGAA